MVSANIPVLASTNKNPLAKIRISHFVILTIRRIVRMALFLILRADGAADGAAAADDVDNATAPVLVPSASSLSSILRLARRDLGLGEATLSPGLAGASNSRWLVPATVAATHVGRGIIWGFDLSYLL